MKATVFFLQALIASVMATPIASLNSEGEGVSVNDNGDIVLRGTKPDQPEQVLSPTDVQLDQLLTHAVAHEDVNLGTHGQWPGSEYAPYSEREEFAPYPEHEGSRGYSQASYPPVTPHSEYANEYYPEYAEEGPARGRSEPLRPAKEPSLVRASSAPVASKAQEVPIMTGTYELMLKPGACDENETPASTEHGQSQVPEAVEPSSSRRSSNRHHRHEASSASQSSNDDTRDTRGEQQRESRHRYGHGNEVSAQGPPSSSWCGGAQPLQPPAQPAAPASQYPEYHGHRQTHRAHESQHRHNNNKDDEEEEQDYENRSRHESSNFKDEELHDRLLDELRSECGCLKGEGMQAPVATSEGHRTDHEGTRPPYGFSYPTEEHPRPRPHFGYSPPMYSEPHGQAQPHSRSPNYYAEPVQEPLEQGVPQSGMPYDQQPGLQMPPQGQMPAAAPYTGEAPHRGAHSGWSMPHNRHNHHNSHFPHFQQQHNPTFHQYPYSQSPQYAQPFSAASQQVPYAQQAPYSPRYGQHHASRPAWHLTEGTQAREKRHHLAPRSLDFESGAGPAYNPYMWQHPSRAHSAPPYSSYSSMGYSPMDHYYGGPGYDRYDPRGYEPRESHVSEPHITVQFPPIYPDYMSREYHGSSASDSSCSSVNTCGSCGNQGSACNCGNSNNCGNCGNNGGSCGNCGNCGNCCNCESSPSTPHYPVPTHPCAEPEQPAASPSYVYSYPQYTYTSNCETGSCGNQNCQSCQSDQCGGDIYGNTGCYAQTGNEAASKAGRLLHSVLCPWQLFSKCDGSNGCGSGGCGRGGCGSSGCGSSGCGSSGCGSSGCGSGGCGSGGCGSGGCSGNGGCGSSSISSGCCGSQMECCEPVKYEPCVQPYVQPCVQPQPVYQPCPEPCPAPQPVYQPCPAPQPQPCVQQPQPQPCVQQPQPQACVQRPPPQPCVQQPPPQPCVQQPQPCAQPCSQPQSNCNQCGGSGCGICGGGSSDYMEASAAEGGRCIRWMFCPWSWFGDRFDNNVNSHRGKHSGRC